MLTRPQPHEANAEATTHKAEATNHEAETDLEILLIIIPLFSTASPCQWKL